MSGWLREIADRRELLLILVERNLKIRYKHSALGFLWTLLGPLFMIAIYWIFLSILKIRISIEALVVGILVWQFLAMCVGDSLHAVLGNANLVTKTAFPRIILPLSTVTANLVNFLLSLAALGLFLLVIRVPPGPLYWLPLLLLTQFALCLGLSLLVSSLNVFYRDVEHLVNVLLLAWFFVSPVMYTLAFVEANPRLAPLIGWYLANPMAGVLAGYRTVLLGAEPVAAPLLIAPYALCWGVLGLGLLVFRRLEGRFGDEL